MNLRTRLSLGYAVFFAAVLALIGLGLVLYVRQVLFREATEQLAASAELIQQDFDASNDDLAAYFGAPAFLLRTHPPRIEGLESPTLYVQVRDLDGAAVVSSASMQGLELPLSDADRRRALAEGRLVTEANLSGRSVLLLSMPLTADGRPVGVLEVAEPLREVEATLRWLSIGLAAAGAAALLAAVRGGIWMAGRALRPVVEVNRTARQIIGAEDLARRVPETGHDDEIGELTATVNDLLARLERLFESQRHLIADVSHELRTPLAAMRGHVELLQRGARDPELVEEELGVLSREIARATRLVGDLLTLAQADAGEPVRRERVALDELVIEVVRDLRPLAGAVELRPSLGEQVEAFADRDRVKQALVNLAANALQHTPPGGRVELCLEREGEAAVLRVRDTGAGIAPEHLPRVFDRFYRADSARSRRRGGAGLGLAIVRWIAEAHGGSVAVESELGRGSTFTLTIPIALPAAEPSRWREAAEAAPGRPGRESVL